MNKVQWLEDLITTVAHEMCVYIEGPPGCGKTQIPVELAKKLNGIGITCHCPDMLVEDVTGCPSVEGVHEYDTIFGTHDKTTAYAVPRQFLPLLGPNAEGMLILDEFASAPPDVQKALGSVIHDRRIGHAILGPKVRIVATGNRKSDHAGASQLPSHIRNRVLWVPWKIDLRDDWIPWAREWVYAGRTFPNWILGYLRAFPSDAMHEPDGEVFAYPTYRTWEKVAKAQVLMGTMEFPVLSGLLGEAIAYKALGFLKIMKEQSDPKELLDNPKGTWPGDIQHSYALMSALVEYSPKTRDGISKLAICMDKMKADFEIVYMALKDFSMKDPEPLFKLVDEPRPKEVKISDRIKEMMS